MKGHSRTHFTFNGGHHLLLETETPTGGTSVISFAVRNIDGEVNIDLKGRKRKGASIWLVVGKDSVNICILPCSLTMLSAHLNTLKGHCENKILLEM